MATIVNNVIKINKSIDSWSTMVKSQDQRLGKIGIKFCLQEQKRITLLNFMQ